MRMTFDCCCHTIRQKSSMVDCRGAWQAMYIFSWLLGPCIQTTEILFCSINYRQVLLRHNFIAHVVFYFSRKRLAVVFQLSKQNICCIERTLHNLKPDSGRLQLSKCLLILLWENYDYIFLPFIEVDVVAKLNFLNL